MLVLSRRVNESITVRTPNGDVTFTLVQINGSQVRVGVIAPKEWSILRDNAKKTKVESGEVDG